MLKYFKLIDGSLIEAPDTIILDTIEITNPTGEQYIAAGWKPIYKMDVPKPNMYYRYEPSYTEETMYILQDWTAVISNTIDRTRQLKLQEIKRHDMSPNVNTFTINGMNMWLNKSDRSSLMYSINCEEAMGATMSYIYTNTTPSIGLEIPISYAKSFLQTIEVYAKQSYNITQNHINNIFSMTASEDIINYNYNVGYPDKLTFTL